MQDDTRGPRLSGRQSRQPLDRLHALGTRSGQDGSDCTAAHAASLRTSDARRRRRRRSRRRCADRRAPAGRVVRRRQPRDRRRPREPTGRPACASRQSSPSTRTASLPPVHDDKDRVRGQLGQRTDGDVGPPCARRGPPTSSSRHDKSRSGKAGRTGKSPRSMPAYNHLVRRPPGAARSASARTASLT